MTPDLESLSDRSHRRWAERRRGWILLETKRRPMTPVETIHAEAWLRFPADGRYEMKPCKTCGQRFEAHRQSHIYCDDLCRPGRGFSTVKPTCSICGKQFAGRPNTLYCTESCKAVARRRRSKQRP